ncbi:hypothetical protein KC723_01740 [Candidatus Kaiserbacteria bacterium]|nr:hypothetical protein [Candidatus Kaiserbacteria bacterium]
MSKHRGREHTTLTETAATVVRELKKIPNIKMIAPGEIKTTSRRKSGTRHITCVHTNAGLDLIITGQSVQKVSVHTDDSIKVVMSIRMAKSLRDFAIKERERKPGI